MVTLIRLLLFSALAIESSIAATPKPSHLPKWLAEWIYLVLLFCGIYGAPQASQSSKHDDGMSWEDKQKLHSIAREFLYQMQLLQRQLLPIKLKHFQTMPYQVGLVIGTMREKYKRMMDIYIESKRREGGRIRITGPGIVRYLPMHYMIGMETVRMLEVEIHKYVDLLAKIPEDELFGTPVSFPGSPPGAPHLRAGANRDKTVGTSSATTTTRSPKIVRQQPVKTKRQGETEEDIKMKYRLNYMKQHGLSGYEWSLDHHYGFS